MPGLEPENNTRRNARNVPVLAVVGAGYSSDGETGVEPVRLSADRNARFQRVINSAACCKAKSMVGLKRLTAPLVSEVFVRDVALSNQEVCKRANASSWARNLWPKQIRIRASACRNRVCAIEFWKSVTGI